MFAHITLVNFMIICKDKIHTLLAKNPDNVHKNPDFAQSYNTCGFTHKVRLIV